MNRVKTSLNIDQVGHASSSRKEGVNQNVTNMLNKELTKKAKKVHIKLKGSPFYFLYSKQALQACCTSCRD